MPLIKPVFIIYLSGLLLLTGIADAQNQPGRTSTYSLTADSLRTIDIREKLVTLALQNPTYEIADHNLTIAIYNIRIAKSVWLANAGAQGNVNEFTLFPKTQGNNPIYYPKYNFGISIPFDVFTRIPNTVKIARENYMIAQATRNDKYREIKALVLTKYEDYLLAKQKLEFQTEITQDEFALYKKSEKDFEDNIIKLDDFNKASAAWVGAQMIKLDFQRAVNVAKIELERLIGIRLEDAIAQVK
jgi:outer membrane protein TolC